MDSPPTSPPLSPSRHPSDISLSEVSLLVDDGVTAIPQSSSLATAEIYITHAAKADEEAEMLRDAVEHIWGVGRCDVTADGHKAIVSYDRNVVSDAEIARVIAGVGFSPSLSSSFFDSRVSVLSFVVTSTMGVVPLPEELQCRIEMDPGISSHVLSCSSPPDSLIEGGGGDWDLGRCDIEVELRDDADPRFVFEVVTRIIEEDGLLSELRAVTPRHRSDDDSSIEVTAKRTLFPVGVCGLLTSLILILDYFSLSHLHFLLLQGLPLSYMCPFLLSIPMQVYFGHPRYAAAYRSLLSAFRVRSDFPLLLSSLLSFAFSILTILYTLSMTALRPSFLSPVNPHDVVYFFDASAVFLTLAVLSSSLPSLASAYFSATSRANIQKLQVFEAILMEEGRGERHIDVRLCREGDLLRVAMGARIPLDGEVCQGTSEVDEGIFGSQSKLSHKSPGDLVFGGTLNRSGTLIIRVTKTLENGSLAAISRSLENIEYEPSVWRKHSEFAVKCLCLSSPAIAVLAFFGWFLSLTFFSSSPPSSPATVAFSITLNLLLSLVPVTLELSHILPIASLRGVATESGIVFRSCDAIRQISEMGTLLFLRTGVLTRGQLGMVEDVVCNAMPSISNRSSVVFLRQSFPSPSESPKSSQSPSYSLKRGGKGILPPSNGKGGEDFGEEKFLSDGDAIDSDSELYDLPIHTTPHRCAPPSLSSVAYDVSAFDISSEFKSDDLVELHLLESGEESSQSNPNTRTTRCLVQSLIYALESRCDHLIAKFLTKSLRPILEGRGTLVSTMQLAIKDYEIHKGLGVRGTFHWIDAGSSDPSPLDVYVGSREFLVSNGVKFGINSQEKSLNGEIWQDLFRKIEGDEARGRGVVYVALNGALISFIILSDDIRPEGREVIRSLKALGLELILLSGGTYRSVHAVANMLDQSWSADSILCELGAKEKSKLVTDMLSDGKKKCVGVVGDGSSDEAILSKHPSGFAMAGSVDLTSIVCGVLLLCNDLRDLQTTIELAIATNKAIKMSFVGVVIYFFLSILFASGFLQLCGLPILPLPVSVLMFFVSFLPPIIFALLLRKPRRLI
jgi:cation transport ATPase